MTAEGYWWAWRESLDATVMHQALPRANHSLEGRCPHFAGRAPVRPRALTSPFVASCAMPTGPFADSPDSVAYDTEPRTTDVRLMLNKVSEVTIYFWREAFYWLAILFTFALGTAAGDLVAEKLNLGYWKSALLFAGIIAIVAVAWFWLRLHAVLAFWVAYVMTRPLGASIGDYLSQDKESGGLELGTATVTAIFLTIILAIVIYLTVTKRDQVIEPEETEAVTSNGVRRTIIDRQS
jgi:hypothetical protein